MYKKYSICLSKKPPLNVDVNAALVHGYDHTENDNAREKMRVVAIIVNSI